MTPHLILGVPVLLRLSSGGGDPLIKRFQYLSFWQPENMTCKTFFFPQQSPRVCTKIASSQDFIVCDSAHVSSSYIDSLSHRHIDNIPMIQAYIILKSYLTILKYISILSLLSLLYRIDIFSFPSEETLTCYFFVFGMFTCQFFDFILWHHASIIFYDTFL